MKISAKYFDLAVGP